jgi:glyoxylase-like metal-dependent hydrolase (beta-lactamase superfamily II)
MIEVADRVFIRRHAVLDQTLGVVVGHERCLVVDTGTDEVHGAEWRAALRALTPLPWAVLITHSHWDHFLGTAAFLPCPVWAHPRCAEEIAEHAEEHRAEGTSHFRDAGDTGRADRLGAARVVVPTDLVSTRVRLDLGGRPVTLLHPGRGHTAGDVVAHVPDAGVLFAGDLVEQGAPPSIGPDAYPAEWLSSLDILLALAPRIVLPGHGDPVDPAFVAEQREVIRAAGST